MTLNTTLNSTNLDTLPISDPRLLEFWYVNVQQGLDQCVSFYSAIFEIVRGFAGPNTASKSLANSLADLTSVVMLTMIVQFSNIFLP